MKSIPTIYEDKDILVINKPAGIMVHADGKSKEVTIADKILKEYPKMKEVGEPMKVLGKNKKEIILYRPGIVHRLDKDTSGVMVIAKNQKTFLFLKNQFKNRFINKTYKAIVYGRLTANKGIIDRPLGRSRKDFRQFSANTTARGELREAVTEYKVLSKFQFGKSDFTYLEVSPKTGRTHQIRVHLKFINHPVVSDKTYASGRGEALGMKRLALHAAKIEFEAPNGKKVSYEAPLPTDMEKALKNRD